MRIIYFWENWIKPYVKYNAVIAGVAKIQKTMRIDTRTVCDKMFLPKQYI